MTKALKDKIIESLTSILPIALIVLVLSVAFVPLEAGTFVLFLVGVFLLIVGLGCFMLGADMSMLVIGEKIGATMTHSRKIWLIALLSFIIGIIVTIAEPDLQILAEQVPAIAEKTPLGNYLLILTVAVGVGIFLTIGMLRIVFRIPLHYLLILFYAIAFVLSIFVSPDFWAVSFDSGGVTTGPMTVPFIMSLGVGVASIRSGKGSKNDSFGLVALSSVGPIIAVLTLGIIFDIQDIEYTLEPLTEVGDTRGVFFEYLHGFGDYAQEVAIALSPIIAFFILFQLASRVFRKRQIVRIVVIVVIVVIGRRRGGRGGRLRRCGGGRRGWRRRGRGGGGGHLSRCHLHAAVQMHLQLQDQRFLGGGLPFLVFGVHRERDAAAVLQISLLDGAVGQIVGHRLHRLAERAVSLDQLPAVLVQALQAHHVAGAVHPHHHVGIDLHAHGAVGGQQQAARHRDDQRTGCRRGQRDDPLPHPQRGFGRRELHHAVHRLPHLIPEVGHLEKPALAVQDHGVAQAAFHHQIFHCLSPPLISDIWPRCPRMISNPLV